MTKPASRPRYRTYRRLPSPRTIWRAPPRLGERKRRDLPPARARIGARSRADEDRSGRRSGRRVRAGGRALQRVSADAARRSATPEASCTRWVILGPLRTSTASSARAGAVSTRRSICSTRYRTNRRSPKRSRISPRRSLRWAILCVALVCSEPPTRCAARFVRRYFRRSAEYEAELRIVRAMLGDEAFDAQWRIGSSITLERALEEAREAVAPPALKR